MQLKILNAHWAFTLTPSALAIKSLQPEESPNIKIYLVGASVSRFRGK